MSLSADCTEHRANALRLIPPSRRRNTELARRRRHVRLMREFARDLGIEKPTAAERELLRQAATMTLRAEQLQTAIERGEAIEGDEVVRLSGHLRRLFAGLQREPADTEPSLQEYITATYSDPESAPADGGHGRTRKRRSLTTDSPKATAGPSP